MPLFPFRMEPHHDVFKHRHLAEELDILKGADHAEGGEFLRRQPGHVSAVEQNRSGSGGVDAGHDVEQRGLAGTVGTNDAGDTSTLNGKGNVIKGRNTAEALGDSLNLKHRRLPYPRGNETAGTDPGCRARARRA